MGKLALENGFVQAAMLVVVLIAVIGALYLMGRRDVDVAEAGKAVAGDLENAAQAVQETSKDAILTAKVKTALALSKSGSAFAVDVDSEDESVTLTGVLPSSEAKAAIVEIARDTEGVVEVVDRLTVDPSAGREELQRRLAELEIETAVYERLLRADAIDARSIRVSVEGRVVRLSGSVPDSFQRERAGELVGSIAGVESVRNHLEISDRDPRSPVSRLEESAAGTSETSDRTGTAASKLLRRILAAGPARPSLDEEEPAVAAALRARAMAP
jgi:osmotically-inducible protein OsmY